MTSMTIHILHLAQFRATSLTDAEGVEITITHATDADGDPTDNFSGNEEFEIDPSVGMGTVVGRIDGGEFNSDIGVGGFPLRITFPGIDDPITYRLFGARITATIDESRIEGRIAGALPAEDTADTLIPVLHLGLLRTVAEDCDDGVCAPGSTGEFILDIFDEDEAGHCALLLERIPKALVHQAQSGEANCPEGAIRVTPLSP